MGKPEPEVWRLRFGAMDALLVGPGSGRGRAPKYLAACSGSACPPSSMPTLYGLYRELADWGFLGAPRAGLPRDAHPGEFASLTGIGAERALAKPAA